MSKKDAAQAPWSIPQHRRVKVRATASPAPPLPALRAARASPTPRHAGFLLVEVVVALFVATLIFIVLAGLTSFAVLVAKTSDNLTGATALAAAKVEELRVVRYDALMPGGSTTEDIAGYFDNPDADNDGSEDFVRRWSIEEEGTRKQISVFVSSGIGALGMPRDASMTVVVVDKGNRQP